MGKKYLTQDKIRKNTLSDIFLYILEKKQTTRREIEHETGFSWGTVSENVAYLIDNDYVTEEKNKQKGIVGRTTYILKPTSDKVASIGLDINLSGFSCTILALDSHVINKMEAKFTAKTQKELLSQSEALCDKAVDWCNKKGLKIFSLGIAMQGDVNGKEGICMRFPNIEDWQPYNIKEHFAQKFNQPTYLGHDPKCMLLGQTQSADDCILLRIDSGIGMAIMLDGKILYDAERFELGHTLAVDNGKKCSCGKKGCLEMYGTLSAISAKNEQDIFELPEKFSKELSEAGTYLAKALYNIYVLFKPQKLILTGKATQLTAFTDSAVKLLNADELEIVIDSNISAAYGAAKESMKSAIKSFVYTK